MQENINRYCKVNLLSEKKDRERGAGEKDRKRECKPAEWSRVPKGRQHVNCPESEGG